MTIAAGSRLGPYEILAPLGAGGWVRSTEPGTPSYVQQQAGPRIRVFRFDPATGRRGVWKEQGQPETRKETGAGEPLLVVAIVKLHRDPRVVERARRELERLH